MTKVDGGQQRNNQPTKEPAKAGGGGGGNSNSNGSSEDGDGDGNTMARVMDSHGRWDGDGNDGWHNGNATATWRRLMAQQHLQYMERWQRDNDDGDGRCKGNGDGNGNGWLSGNSNVRRDGNAGAATTMDGTTVMQRRRQQWTGRR